MYHVMTVLYLRYLIPLIGLGYLIRLFDQEESLLQIISCSVAYHGSDVSHCVVLNDEV